VQKATPELLEELSVNSWGVWSTAGSPKYKVGIKSPLKVYDGNELSYVISGKMTITPESTGVPVPVNAGRLSCGPTAPPHAQYAGDFVTFPHGFRC